MSQDRGGRVSSSAAPTSLMPILAAGNAPRPGIEKAD